MFFDWESFDGEIFWPDWENWVLYCSVMLVNHATVVKCFKDVIAMSVMLTLMPIFLLYSWQCVPMAVKWIVGLERESVLFLGRGAYSGTVSGAAVCTHVLYAGLYSCLVSRLAADPFSQSVQLPNRCLQTFLSTVPTCKKNLCLYVCTYMYVCMYVCIYVCIHVSLLSSLFSRLLIGWTRTFLKGMS